MSAALPRSAPTRWQRALLWWLRATFAFLAVSAAVLSARYPARAVVFLVLVPLSYLPFCYARARVFARCNAILTGKQLAHVTCAALLIAGGVADAIMLAQLLTARSTMHLPLIHATGVTWVGAVWFSAHVVWLFGHLLSKAVKGLTGRLQRAVKRWRGAGALDQPQSMERRAALQQLTVLSVGAPFAVSLSGVSTSYDFRVDEHDIWLPNWPRELDGLRVAHLSDIHVGGSMNRERLRRVAELTNDARPDLVLHTGDFLTHRSGNFDEPLYEALARVECDLGQWACLGNHDYENPERLVRRLRDAGVRTLRSALATLSVGGTELEIAGLDFSFARLEGAKQYPRMMAGWRPRDGRPRILLNHDPTGFALLPDNCADLVCSGHTHGGHVGVQLGQKAVTVVGLIGIPDQGVFTRHDMRLFVTRCVGFYGYPIRLGIPPEIALLTIRSRNQAG